MNSSKTAIAMASLTALGAVSTANAKEAPRPNVIIIMTDQHRFDYLGSVDSRIITPNLDALSDDGVRFANAYSSTPSSTPARAALLTGQSPWHHGMIGYHARVAPKYPKELPQMLSDAGYYSYAIGKMHYFPQRALHGFAGAELDESGRVESPGFVSDYRQWFADQARAMGEPTLNPDSTGIDWNGHAAAEYALPERLHPTAWTGDRAVQFIDNYDIDKPLFLKVSFARPHSPYDPPRRYVDMYTAESVDDPAIGDWASEYARKTNDPTAAYADFGAEYARKSRIYYAASITFIDDQIGRIIEALKEHGMYDNTLIIFTSDHGDMLGDHHHWRKTYPYEGSSHVPFIVHAPKGMKRVERGSVRPELVEIRDIMPTFLDAAGVESPSSVDGRSILPLLTKKADKATWRTALDLEHSQCYGPASGWVALVDSNRYKYVWNYGRGTEELFDLRHDPHELHSLHDQASQSVLLAEFRHQMAQHLSERGPEWVSPDGKLLVNKNVSVLTPNYPGNSK